MYLFIIIVTHYAWRPLRGLKHAKQETRELEANNFTTYICIYIYIYTVPDYIGHPGYFACAIIHCICCMGVRVYQHHWFPAHMYTGYV